MSNRSETRHPDFAGLNLATDPAGVHAIKADNVDLRRLGEISKRMGLRRVNQIRYHGAIVCVPDVQRICDYGRMLVLDYTGDIYSHESPVAPGADPFWKQGYPPVAHAFAAPMSGMAPLTVNFSSQGSFDPDGGPLTYFWNFGDGGSSVEANPQHDYLTGGVKNVTLTVTDLDGETAVATTTVTVANPNLIISGSGSLRYSEDLGASWQDCAGGPPVGGGWGSHLLTLVNGHVLYFTKTGPVWISTDNGKTFALQGTLAPAMLELTVCDPIELASGRIVIALRVTDGLSTGRWMAYSDNEGAAWTKKKICDDVGVTLSQTYLAPTLFAASDRLLAAVYRNGGGAPGATVNQWFESLDFGANWAYKRDATIDEVIDVSAFAGSWPESFGGDILTFKGAANGYNQMRSVNAGLTTAIVAAGLGNNILAIRHLGALGLCVRGGDPGAGQYSVYETANSGATWNLVQVLATYTRRPLGSGIGWFLPMGDGTVWFSATIAGPLASLGGAGAGTPDSMAMSPRI